MMMEEIEQTASAVLVRDAYKRFTPSAIVLRGLNMTVLEGTIYGFLGPSGCGKTTLLSCLVGRTRLDSGDIQLSVKSRSNIGYMPQELALSKELTISETMKYYACLHGMNRTEFNKRKEELYRFLELPDENKTIGTCSGGQQRRTSLCVALLHNPQLLILDEPTCGVDPVLSHSIWQHLMMLSRDQKKTIIITTHYIEEARQAQRIGLMRGGVILDENEPNHLLAKYNCDTLEKVFLLLSQKQAASFDETKAVNEYPNPKRKPEPPIKPKKGVSLHHLNSHIVKSYYWLRASKPIVGFLMLLPIVQCVLYELSVGRDPLDLKIGFINDEIMGGRDRCYSFPNSSCSLDVGASSCLYLEKLEARRVTLIEFWDKESARSATQKNHIWGFFHIHSNYTTALKQRANSTLDVDDMAVDQSEIQIWMDMSNQYIGNLLKRSMYLAYEAFLKELFISCDINEKLAKIPIQWKPAVYGTNEPSFTEFAIPAILQLFEFYLPMMFTVGAILMEKREGILERSLISGMTLPEVLIGHAIVQFTVLALQTLFMLIVLYVIFDNIITGSVTLALLLLFLVGVSGMCYGYLVSVLCDSDQAATYMGLGSFFPLAMLSGMVWPFEGMHWILRSIGWVLPLTMTTESFRAIATRGLGFTHYIVYRGFISSCGWIVFFCVGTYAIIAVQKGIKLT